MSATNPLRTRKLTYKSNMLVILGIIIFTIRMVISGSIIKTTTSDLQIKPPSNINPIVRGDFARVDALCLQKNELGENIEAFEDYSTIYELNSTYSIEKIRTLGDKYKDWLLQSMI